MRPDRLAAGLADPEHDQRRMHALLAAQALLLPVERVVGGVHDLVERRLFAALLRELAAEFVRHDAHHQVGGDRTVAVAASAVGEHGVPAGVKRAVLKIVFVAAARSDFTAAGDHDIGHGVAETKIGGPIAGHQLRGGGNWSSCSS